MTIKKTLSLLLVLFSFSLYAQTHDADSLRSLPQGNTKIIIQSNVADAEVYLNGIFYGNTSITIADLTPGFYKLDVKKNGYETRQVHILVKDGQEQTYYIELKKYTGFVFFTSNVPHTIFYIDNEIVYDNKNELAEGRHTVQAVSFGYKTLQKEIFVFHNTIQTIEFSLEKADFTISALRANKASFNPQLNGYLGKIILTFSVTAPGEAVLTIIDENGEAVRKQLLNNFNTWTQSFIWDGKDDTGNYIKDGQYTVTLKNDNQTLACAVTIDSSIRLPVSQITIWGSGSLATPQATMYPSQTSLVQIDAGSTEKFSSKSFYSLPLSFSFASTPLSFLEYSFTIKAFSAMENTPVNFSAAIKSGSTIKKGLNTAFNWAVILKTGFSSQPLWAPYGICRENGSGLGFCFGFDSKNFYAGTSTLFVTGSENGSIKKGDAALKNSITFQNKGQKLNSAIDLGINSCYIEKSVKYIQCVECGTFISYLLNSNNAYINFSQDFILYKTAKYSYTNIGLKYILP